MKRISVVRRSSASVVASDAPAHAVSVALGVRSNGNAFVAWQDARGPSYDIWGAYYTASSGSWDTPTMVSDDPAATAQMRPAVAMNATEIAPHARGKPADNRARDRGRPSVQGLLIGKPPRDRERHRSRPHDRPQA